MASNGEMSVFGKVGVLCVLLKPVLPYYRRNIPLTNLVIREWLESFS